MKKKETFSISKHQKNKEDFAKKLHLHDALKKQKRDSVVSYSFEQCKKMKYPKV